VAGIVVSRLIGRTGMGQLGIVQSTVGMFSVLASMSLGLTATKHVAEHRIGAPALVGETIGLLSLISWTSGAVMTVIVLFLSPWLATHTLAAPELEPQLKCGSLLLLLGVVNGVQTGVLSGFEAFKCIARINLICGLANFPIMICGAYFGGMPGAVWGLVANLGLNCVLNFLAVRREAAAVGAVVTYRHVHKHWNLLWQFGLPAMLAGMISGPVNWGTGAYLVNQKNGYSEMGILNATNSWFQAVAFMPNLLGQVLLPILAGYMAARNRAGLNRALAVATLANFLLVLPVVAIGSALSRRIMSLYGPGFSDGWMVLVMTLASAGVLAVQAPITDRLIAMSRMWAYLLASIIWALVHVTLTWFLAPKYGSAGLAFARLAAYAAGGVAVTVLAWRCTRQGPELARAI
jgi:O-antigen/teichoic acid export membrane protein